MTRLLPALSLAACLGLAAPVLAQQAAPAGPQREPRDKGTYFSNEQMKAIGDAVVDKATGKPGGYSKRLISYSTHSTALIRLVKAEGPHAHGTVSEVFVVRSGSGVLETGGTITGITGHDSATHKDLFLDPQQPRPAASAPRVGAPGDLAGTDVVGGVRQAMKPGDIILIPAGVSHRWVEVGEGGVTYLDIKFPKAD